MKERCSEYSINQQSKPVTRPWVDAECKGCSLPITTHWALKFRDKLSSSSVKRMLCLREEGLPLPVK